MTPELDVVNFDRPGGGRCPGYLGEPIGKVGGGVVLIHEMWGVTRPMRELVERLAAAGYRTALPDLHRGAVESELERGLARMAALDFREAAIEDVRGAVRFLAGDGRPVAAVGFCMGGAISILAAALVPELRAAVSFYGVPSPEAYQPGDVGVPLLGHFAQRDDWCTPRKVDALEGALRAARVPHEFHRYDAGHAFMNPDGPTHDPRASELAWQRTREFLARELRAAGPR